MVNGTLYRREMKGSLKLLLFFAAIITMYVSIIISMYDPEMMATLDSFSQAMPELMAAVGMTPGASTLLGFMISYLYGFILLVFPMVYAILRGNGLIAKHVDQGSMVALVAAPVKRLTVAFTQMLVLVSGIFLLVAYATCLEYTIAEISFPGELELQELLAINGGLLALQLALGGICFLASCIFSDTKYSLGLGAGLPALMFILQMLANAGEKAEAAKYFTLFTLYDPNGVLEGSESALLGIGILAVLALIFYLAGIFVFTKKDLHI